MTIKTITLDPNIWLRGSEDGSLLNVLPDGRRKQCCIGVACTVLGVPDAELGGKGMLEDIDQAAIPSEFGNVIHLRQGGDGDEWLVDSLDTVYSLNDSSIIQTDAERVEQINAELEKLKASIRFSLDDERRADAGEGA